MSARATGWTWDNSPYRGTKLLVHLAIADVVNDQHDHRFYMAASNLAEKVHCTRTEVSRIMKQMVVDGYLTIVEDNSRAGRPSCYRFEYQQESADRCADSAQGVCGSRTRNSIELKVPPASAGGRASLVAVGDGEAPWRSALATCVNEMPKAKSFDAIKPFMSAWDALHELDMEPTARAGNLIALTIGYIEYVMDEPLDGRMRAMVAKTVRQHGKVALFAWDKALFATEDDTPAARMAYARGIINRLIAEQSKAEEAS